MNDIPRLISRSLLITVLVHGAVGNLVAADGAAADWAEFRGPTRDGHSSAKDVPVSWSATENVVWKQKIAGQGWSSPVIVGDRVYLTAAVPIDGTANDFSLRLLALDFKSGEFVGDWEVFRQDGTTAPGIHGKNSHASPTPIVAGNRIYVHFGHQGTACLDTQGNILWSNRSLAYPPVHGNGGSPLLVDDLLIFSCDGATDPFVVALGTADGQVRWKTARNQETPKKFAFSTPQLVTAGGQRLVISPGGGCVVAYRPEDGQEAWRVRYEGYSVIPQPVFGHGLVFVATGYDSPNLLAIRADGRGDISDTHIAWKVTQGVPHAPSLLLNDDDLYLVADNGVASCLDAKSGKEHWKKRLGGSFSASPVFADGRIYFLSESGTTSVIRPGHAFDLAATNELGERSLASPAVTDGTLVIRTEQHLYRLGTGRN